MSPRTAAARHGGRANTATRYATLKAEAESASVLLRELIVRLGEPGDPPPADGEGA